MSQGVWPRRSTPSPVSSTRCPGRCSSTSKTSDLATRPELAAFVDYYLSDEGLAWVADAGYVQLPAADIEETRAAWAGAAG